MILADKIIDLRKKNGWSQEELAEKLDVSRQSISKWESAQSVPDLSRVIRMAELFGVSTDYLLKDDMESLEPVESMAAAESSARLVTMEEANAFLGMRELNAQRISLGVLLCILCPVPVMLLVGTEQYGRFGLQEIHAVGISLILLFAMVGCAVALFVTSGLRSKRFSYLTEGPIETLYGVDGMVRERMERGNASFVLQLTLGIVLCVVSVLPIFVALILFGEDAEAPIAVGVRMIVRSAIVRGGFRALLEEGDYSRREKALSKRFGPYEGAYWLIVTAAYLAISFLTKRWDVTWIIWPVAAVANGAFFGIARAMSKRDGE